MAKFNISQAAKLYSKDWKTIKRHIAKGKLSQESDGLIDMAELIRAYGEPKSNAPPTPENNNKAMPDYASPKIEELFGRQVKMLERQVEDLREERDRRLGIVENQTRLLEYKPTPENQPTLPQPVQVKSLSWLHATLIGCGLVGASIGITVAFVTLVVPHF